MNKILLVWMCVSVYGFSQHSIPFASTNAKHPSDNRIELSIANASMVATENVTVEVSTAPHWLDISNRKVTIENLNANESHAAHFAFSVDKSAPVNKPEQVVFTISNANGERWTKTLFLQVSPPEKFELFQNYPNSFNPITTISYLLPAVKEVDIRVFDVTGGEVITLFSGIEEPGYHQHEWRAMSVASGMYIYQVVMKNERGGRQYYRKKMLLLR